MRILLIGNRETSPTGETYFKQYVDFIEQAVAKSEGQIEVAFTLFSDLYIGVGDGKFTIFDTRNGQDLRESDVLLLRGARYRQYYDVVKAISLYAREHNSLAINDYSEVRDSSKLTQALQFHEVGLPVAYSVYANEAVLTGKHPLEIDFPCIMKATFASHGDDNHLISSLQEAVDIQARSPEKWFVLQRFVPNDGDFRLLIIGEEVVVIHRAPAEGSHLNNTSRGGTANLKQADVVPPAIIAGAKRLMEHLQMAIAGADVLADKQTGEFYFLELNAQPQLMTGAYTDTKAQMLSKYFERIMLAQRQADVADLPE